MARLGDVCNILNGYAFKSENYVDKGIRVIRIANVQKGYIEDNTPQFYPENTDEDISKYMLYSGDLLLSLTGNVGRVAILTEAFLPAALNQRVACLRIKRQDVDKSYLYHYLNSDSFEHECIMSSKGVAQKNMSTEWLKEYDVLLPPIEKQKHVAAALDTLANLIALRKQQLIKLDELVKARFVEMFGDPVTNPNRFEIKSLPDIAEFYNGLTYRPEDVSESGTIVLRSNNIQDNQLNFEDIVRVSCPIRERLYVKANDILMCSRNGSARLVGKVAQIKNLKEPMSFGAFMMIIRSKYYPYLFTYFQMEAFRRQIKTGVTTTINQITVRMLEDVKIPVPNMEYLSIFARFFSKKEESRLTIQQSLDKLETLKKTLMQEYFG